jgi:glycosyltransferase (activator-dependent family)
MEDSMRVLFATVSEKSHLFNLVPIAWALRAAGHEVCVASQPALVDAIVQSGLPAVSVGTDHKWYELIAQYRGTAREDEGKAFDPFTASDDELPWEYLQGFYSVTVPIAFAMLNDTMVDGLVQFATKWQPDLVIWDAITYSGAVAAKVTGAAHARMVWGADVWSPLRDRFLMLKAQQPEESRNDPMINWLEPVMRRHGHEFDEELVSGQWTMHQLPSSLRKPTELRNYGLQFVAYNGPADIPDWLRDEPARPRVCLTLGGTMTALGGDFVSIPDLIEAVAGLDVEVVATLNSTQQEKLTAVPDNVRICDYVPLNALLPTCSAIVHHGGSGTYTTALRYGVPQMILPENGFAETVYLAKTLEDAGASLYTRASTATVDGIRDRLARLLAEPSFRESAARLRQEMLGEPTPAELVPLLEKLTAEHQG